MLFIDGQVRQSAAGVRRGVPAEAAGAALLRGGRGRAGLRAPEELRHDGRGQRPRRESGRHGHGHHRALQPQPPVPLPALGHGGECSTFCLL